MYTEFAAFNHFIALNDYIMQVPKKRHFLPFHKSLYVAQNEKLSYRHIEIEDLREHSSSDELRPFRRFKDKKVG